MPIRITCSACRTSMKIPDGITEQKKVRCVGCSIVILVTPDPTKSDGVTISIPRKSARQADTAQSSESMYLVAGVAAIILFSLVGLYYFFRVPESDAPYVKEGRVLLDEWELESGTITFTPKEPAEGAPFTTKITHGLYSIGAEANLKPGKYKVEIFGDENNRVHFCWNTESKLECDLKSGKNELEPWKVTERQPLPPPPPPDPPDEGGGEAER